MIYKFEFTGEQLAILSEALAAMPYIRVAPLIEELRSQMAAQKKQVEENK